MSNIDSKDKGAKPDWAKTKSELRYDETGQKSIKGKVIFGIIILILVALFVLAKSQNSSANPAESDTALSFSEEVQVKYLAPEELSKIQRQTLARELKVTGALQPLSTHQAPALVSARVESINVRPGDTVTKGQKLVAMDTESLTLQMQQQQNATEATRAQLALAKSQLLRTRDLSSRGIATSSQLEEAASSVDALTANLAAQESQIDSIQYSLRNAIIYSPSAGVVSQRNAEPGQFVSAGVLLLEIVDLSTLELKANIPSTSVDLIKTGMTVNVSVESLPGKTFLGTISRISPVTNTGTRTIPIYITLNNNDQTLKGGLFAVGKITLDSKSNAIGINETAIHDLTSSSPWVLKVIDNKIIRQAVTLGGSWQSNQLREVTSGLSEGDVIVNLPLSGLEENDSIEIIGG